MRSHTNLSFRQIKLLQILRDSGGQLPAHEIHKEAEKNDEDIKYYCVTSSLKSLLNRHFVEKDEKFSPYSINDNGRRYLDNFEKKFKT